MNPWGAFLLILIFVASGIARGAEATAAPESKASPKVTLRTGMGSFVNEGTSGGSTTGTGGFSLQYHHFLSPNLSIGLGYSALFDMNTKGTPLAGYELLGRWYFRTPGTVVTTKDSWGELVSQEPWTPYAVGFYSLRKFYLGEDNLTTDPAKQLTGEYGIINAGLGLDYRLNRNFELNAEYNMSLFTFTSTDARVRIAEKVMWLGVNYVF